MLRRFLTMDAARLKDDVSNYCKLTIVAERKLLSFVHEGDRKKEEEGHWHAIQVQYVGSVESKV